METYENEFEDVLEMAGELAADDQATAVDLDRHVLGHVHARDLDLDHRIGAVADDLGGGGETELPGRQRRPQVQSAHLVRLPQVR